MVWEIYVCDQICNLLRFSLCTAEVYSTGLNIHSRRVLLFANILNLSCGQNAKKIMITIGYPKFVSPSFLHVPSFSMQIRFELYFVKILRAKNMSWSVSSSLNETAMLTKVRNFVMMLKAKTQNKCHN